MIDAASYTRRDLGGGRSAVQLSIEFVGRFVDAGNEILCRSHNVGTPRTVAKVSFDLAENRGNGEADER